MAVTPRLLDTNLIQAAATVLSASSQDPAFTLSKLRDELRSQTWRSVLGWNQLRAASDALDFKEGTDRRVAFLTAGNYPTGALITAQVASAMNAAGISPDSLSPSAWFRPEGLISIADGAAISQWNDDSGNARHLTQATGNLQPSLVLGALNGRSAVRFDGSGRRFGSAATMANVLNGSGHGTVFVVFAVDTDAAANDVLFGQSNSNRLLYVDTTGPNLVARAFDGTQDNATKSGAALGAWHIGLWMYDGTNVAAAVDDQDTAAMATTASGAQTDLSQTLVAGGDGTGHLKGYIAEIIVFASALTEENRRRVTAYLKQKYALTESTTAPAWTNTYASSYDPSTLKVTINRSAGAAAFELNHSTGKQAATSCAKDLGYDVSSDDTGATSYLGDNAVSHGREWIGADLGSAQTFTATAVINHNSGAGGTYKLQWSAASIVAALTAPDGTQSLSGDAVLRYAYPSSQTKRFVVLLIEDTGNTAGYSELGIWYLGSYRQPSVTYSINFEQMRGALSLADIALSGAKRSTRRQRRGDWPLEWLDITDADRAIFEAWEVAAPLYTNFFFAFDSTGEPSNIKYVYADTPLKEDYVPGQYWTLSFHLVEALG